MFLSNYYSLVVSQPNWPQYMTSMGRKMSAFYSSLRRNRKVMNVLLQLFYQIVMTECCICETSSFYGRHLCNETQEIPKRNWLYVITISHRSFRMNLYSIVCLNVNELLAWSRYHIWSLSDSNKNHTHNHCLVYEHQLFSQVTFELNKEINLRT